ncbi:MAG: acetyl-CoA carboxylase biotin carboxylase subunit [Bacteroidetes bacterium]|nr:acetyl-CoA carboxylase biotin carboxylase subunit [Bacteroidota bacterium]
MFKKILIANRGEIAVRVIKACRELGIISAAVYSEIDKNSLHVRAAEEAYFIGASNASESYLNYNKIIELAKEINADAIHPGYGFLSENHNFIKLIEEQGIKFIGPSWQSVVLMGEKTSARKLMKEHGVPIVPGTVEPISDIKEAKKICGEIGYPIMLKASAGGGGKGMHKIHSHEEFENAFEKAGRESKNAFGNSDIYIEKFIEDPKHIEVQILADSYGNYVHLFERECSVQRRHQKVIEEAPSVSVDEITRKKITLAAVNAAKACNYENAGTIEFLMDKDKNVYFLEMNTRLQVEHPVTELITGIDIVKEQIRIASGKKLSFTQEQLLKRGHALECRIYAEDVENNFAPSTGQIIHHRLPSGPGVRVDRGIDLKSEVSVYYDPILSKIITYGTDREEAIERMKRALGEYQIAGVITNIPACRWVLNQKEFLDGTFTINFVDNVFIPLLPDAWKSQNNDDYEIAVSILGALLQKKEHDLKPGRIKNNSSNKWNDTSDE